MTFRIVLSLLARSDLDELSEWIERHANQAVADAYDARLRASIQKLDHFPDRGSLRLDLGEGLRSVTFRRRITIVFKVCDDIVEIIRIVGAERDLPTLFTALD